MSLLTPEEVEENKKERAKKKVANSKKLEQKKVEEGKYFKKGNMVKIQFESGGRFSTPESLWFTDYSTESVNEIITSRMEDMTETIISVLDDCLNKAVSGVDSSYTCADLTPNEFQEVLIGMKIQFDSVFLSHPWMCQCQDDLNDKDKKPSEQEIDLSLISYKSIEFTEQEKVSEILEKLNALSDDEYNEFLGNKYPTGENLPADRNEESRRFIIGEPLNIFEGEDCYHFEFMRMRHIIQAYKTVEKVYDNQIRMAKGNPHKGKDQYQRKAVRDSDVEVLERRKSKDALLCSQAYTLVSINDGPVMKNDEKLRVYKKLARGTMLTLLSAFEIADYGVSHEYESKCNLCDHTDGRSLQRELSPLELLPFPDTDKVSTIKKRIGNSGLNFFFG